MAQLLAQLGGFLTCGGPTAGPAGFPLRTRPPHLGFGRIITCTAHSEDLILRGTGYQVDMLVCADRVLRDHLGFGRIAASEIVHIFVLGEETVFLVEDHTFPRAR